MKKFKKVEKINLNSSKDFNEDMIQKLIENNLELLGLGDLELLHSQKKQITNGKVDMILGANNDEGNRYVVEIQLGKTDPSHIIRCIEYWEIERRRNPSKEYIAVLIAEEITSRYFNVISLFNGAIPIIAIDMKCIKIDDDNYSLFFTKILDLSSIDDEDVKEEDKKLPKDYWQKRASKEILDITDKILELIGKDKGYELKHNKHYIGLEKDGRVNNFIHMQPRKQYLLLMIKYEYLDIVKNKLEQSKMTYYDYNKSMYRIQITKSSLEDSNSVKLLQDLIMLSCEQFAK